MPAIPVLVSTSLAGWGETRAEVEMDFAEYVARRKGCFYESL